MSATRDSDADAAAPRRFETTRWSMVLAAGRQSSPAARQALADLCAAYWHPLYAFVRRRGHPPAEAQDLTQAFFTRLLEKNDLEDARPERGKFRSFLLASMRHFLANEWDRTRAVKRGGGRAIFSIDQARAEERYQREPEDRRTPEVLFERRWALAILEQALARLEEEYAIAGKTEIFAALRPLLAGDEGEPYRDIAARLNVSAGALKVAVHRLRKRFAEKLRAEVAQTVADDEAVGDEIRELFAALRGT